MQARRSESGRKLPFRCKCSAVQGYLSIGPNNGDYVVCYCRDCQQFARQLESEKRTLTPEGGTELFQIRCARMRLTSGRDKLACMHLTDKPTLRWYSNCCSTPLFNTYANGRIPYLSVLLANSDPFTRAEAIGPPARHLFVQGALNSVPFQNSMSVRKLVFRVLKRMFLDIISGERRRSQLFDAHTFAPIRNPTRQRT